MNLPSGKRGAPGRPLGYTGGNKLTCTYSFIYERGVNVTTGRVGEM